MNNHHCLNASVPEHLYGFIASDILHGLDGSKEIEPCVVIGVTSIPSRALHFSVLCESGAQWARIPIHKLYHVRPVREPHPITNLQMWDCHDWNFSVTTYEYLREMNCHYLDREGNKIPASYWFTLDHTDNGFSQYPSEHKCYHLLKLLDGSGQIAGQPNNRIIWHDDSFVTQSSTPRYSVMPPITWHAEVGRNPQDTAFTKD
jgi:hypothetical protein